MATLAEAGYDPADEPVPVSPAAHYAIGGVVADLDARTSVPGLYAAGECACSGRPRREPARLELAARVPRLRPPRRPGGARRPRASTRRDATALADSADPGAELWHDAGLIRSARDSPSLLDSPHPLVREIAASGLAREESRGVHFREDFPVESDSLAGHLVVRPGREPELERWS